MEIVIDSVDYAPDDLDGQTPIRAKLLRTIVGADRPDYWLAELFTPLSWTNKGTTRTIRHLILAARWVGTSIQPGAKLPVGIAYVTNDAALSSATLDLGTTEYVAIGMARVLA